MKVAGCALRWQLAVPDPETKHLGYQSTVKNEGKRQSQPAVMLAWNSKIVCMSGE